MESKRVEREYQDYLDGKYALTRNEIDQLGYRLAKELGHKQLCPIDVEGDFPFDKVQEFAKKNGKQRTQREERRGNREEENKTRTLKYQGVRHQTSGWRKRSD